MKNVLQIMDYAAPYRGNFMESLDRLGKEVQQKGARLIHVFPPRARTGPAARWIDEMRRKGQDTHFLSGRLAHDVRLLRRLIREHGIGIVHTHFDNFRIDLAVHLASMFTGVRKVRHFHNHLRPGSTSRRVAKSLLLRRCTLVGVSESVGAGLRQEFSGNRCHAVDNGISFGRLDRFETLERSDFGLGEDSVVCLMMGFDFRRKGVDLALAAVAALRTRLDIRLMISVASNLDAVRAGIERQLGSVPDWVVLLPPRNDVASYYRLADIFISASREEGFCYALVEAAYCERQVVASRIPAQGDLRIPHAFWFEAENVEELKAQLLAAAARRDDFGAELRRARAAVEHAYDLGSWARRIVSIYESTDPAFSARRTDRMRTT